MFAIKRNGVDVTSKILSTGNVHLFVIQVFHISNGLHLPHLAHHHLVAHLHLVVLNHQSTFRLVLRSVLRSVVM